MAFSVLKDKKVVEHASQRSHKPEERHETTEHVLGHDIVEKIPIHRADKHVEEFKHGHAARQENNSHLCLVVSATIKKVFMHKCRDVVVEPYQNHGEGQKRQASNNKRHSPAPLGAEAIAPDTDGGGDREIKDRRHAGHHQADECARCPEPIHLEWDNAWNHGLHHGEAKVPPEHPGEHGDEPTLGVDEGTARECLFFGETHGLIWAKYAVHSSRVRERWSPANSRSAWS